MICVCFIFFFNDTATTEIYTLSLHDALPISETGHGLAASGVAHIGIPSQITDDHDLVQAASHALTPSCANHNFSANVSGVERERFKTLCIRPTPNCPGGQ